MRIKQELLQLLTSYGMNEQEIAELAGRLVSNADEFIRAGNDAERQLEHNATVREGLLKTIGDAKKRAERAQNLISKIIDLEVD